ncbi:MAG: glutamine synthetase [Chloroflexota bacterium]
MLQELEAMVRDGRIDTLVVAFTDMQGRLLGKRVQAQAFLNGVIDHGIHFCTYLLGTDMEMNTPEGFKLMNWETGYGDWIAEPVWSTLRILPWLERTALVLSDAVDQETHREIPVSPRTMLKRQVAKAASMGYVIKAGSELEYYVLRTSWDEQHRNGWVTPEPFGYYNEDYHVLQGTKAEPLHRLLRNQMTEARVPVEFSKGEAAPGQHEVNIRYDEVLESADRTVIFKHGAKEIAYLNGWGITFMAKPDHRWTGSSGHLHLSVWNADGTRSLMEDPASDAPYQMSKTMRHFLGGMMALSRQLAVFIAPNINSYKRFAALSWAPVNVNWGCDNRTTGFRIVGHGQALRIENRFPGGDMNAYLAYAAMVGAGLWGIEHEVEPPAEYKGNGYIATGCDRMPRALWEAIIELERSKAAVEIFGQDVVDHYLNAARVEQMTYDAVVHPWDRERYLERS